MVQADPYRLARDVYGIGFLTADKIARELGIAADAPERVAAGVAYVLSQAADEGHVYLPAGRTESPARRAARRAAEAVGEAIAALAEADRVQSATRLPPCRRRRSCVAGRGSAPST